MATHHNFKIKNGLEVGGTLIVNSSGQLQAVTATGNLKFLDNVKADFGSGSDLRIFHNGTDSTISNGTGHLNLENTADNKDILLKSDDGSGGVATYFLVDGSQAQSRFLRNVKWEDNIQALFGTSDDLRIVHDGTDSDITNHTGNLNIEQHTDDGDIYFKSDNGSGGVNTYFFLDGSSTQTRFTTYPLKFDDSIKLKFGAGDDLQIHHDGSHSFIQDMGTGSLYIDTGGLIVRNPSNNSNILLGSNAAVTLFHNGNTRLATATSGVNITGSLAVNLGNLTVNEGNAFTDFNIKSDRTGAAVNIGGINFLNASDAIKGQIFGTTNGQIKIFTGGQTEAMRLDESQNVTITGNLTVNGTTTTLNTSTLDVEDKNITLNKGSGDTSGTADGAGITIQDAVDASTDATILWNASTDSFNTSHKLNVTGAITSTGDAFFGNQLTISGTGPTLYFTDTNHNPDYYIQNSNGTLHIRDVTNSSNRISIGTTGNVGIGISAPSAKLDVAGDVAVSGDITITDTSTDPFLKLATSERNYVIRVDNSDADKFQIRDITAGATRLTIGASGNVGIGTTSPSTKLHVDSAEANAIPLSIGTGSNYTMQRWITSAHTGSTAYILAYGTSHASQANNFAMKNIKSGGEIFFELFGVEPLRLTSTGATFAGKVGIGTSSPAEELQVNGTAPMLRLQENSAAAKRLDLSISSAAVGIIGANQSASQLAFETVGSERLRINASGNVGIGTTSPSDKLHVVGDQYLDGDLVVKSSGVGNAISVLQSTSGNNVVKMGESAVGHGFLTLYELGVGDVIKFDANANSFINRGNFGIGTSSPSAKLEIVGLRENQIRLSSSDTTVQANEDIGGIEFYSNDSGNTGVTGFITATSEDAIGTTKLKFGTGAAGSASDKMTILSSGNVGIGTASPTKNLTIVDSSSTTSPLTMPGIEITNDNQAANSIVGISLKHQRSTAGQYSRNSIYMEQFNLSIDCDEALFIKNNGNNSAVVTGGGRFGIGETSPDSILHINTGTGANNANTVILDRAGSTDYSGISFATAGTVDWSIGQNTAGNFEVFEDGADAKTRFTIETDGNVGIGATNPVNKLDVAGTIYSEGGIRMGSASSGEGIFRYNPGAGAGIAIATQLFSTAGIKMFIEHTAAGGGVGIGTTTPSEKLEVVGNIKADTLKVDNITFKDVDGSPTDEINLTTEFDGSNSTLSFEGSAGQLFSVSNDLSGTFFSVNDVSGIPSIEVVDDGTVKLARFSGNVGIGEGSPDAKLHVKDTTQELFKLETDQTSGYARFYEDASERLRIGFGTHVFSAIPSATDVGIRSSNNMHFGTDNNIRMTIRDADGAVGIGTSSPSRPLHVKDNDDVVAFFESTDTTAVIHIKDQNTGVSIGSDASGNGQFAADIDSVGSKDILFKTAGSEIVRMRSTGRVGIGTATPSTKLEVAGDLTLPSNGQIKFKGTNHYPRIYAQNNDLLINVDDGGGTNFTAFKIDNATGRIGIGTTSPGYKVEIVDTTNVDGECLRVKGNATYGGTMLFSRGDSFNWRVGVGGGSSTNSNILSSFWGVEEHGTNSVYLTVAHTTGNVGAGTTNPTEKLHVAGSLPAIKVANTHGTHRYAAIDLGTAGGNWYISNGASKTTSLSDLYISRSTDGTDHRFKFGRDDYALSIYDNSDAVKVFLHADGDSYFSNDLGVGTASPNGTLEVAKNITFSTIDTFGQFVIKSSSGTTGDLLNFGVDSADSLAFIQAVERGTNVIPLVLQRYGGRVGIGTDGPSRELEVSNSSGAATIRISNESNTVAAGGDLGIIEFYSGDNSNSGDSVQASISVIQPTTDNVSGEFVFKTSNAVVSSGALTEKMRITKEGNVGIGTSTPGSKLEVNGSFAATTKSFDIPHPMKEGMRLRYGVLEGPEHGVYVRGKADGYIIKLPEVWKELVREDSITVQLTAIGKPQELYVENIEDNTVYLGIHPGKPIGEYYYYIQAERKDVEKLEVEYGNPL